MTTRSGGRDCHGHKTLLRADTRKRSVLVQLPGTTVFRLRDENRGRFGLHAHPDSAFIDYDRFRLLSGPDMSRASVADVRLGRESYDLGGYLKHSGIKLSF